jgi:hypothetical protein
MLGRILTEGDLSPQYLYLYTDLFVVYNRIYHNGNPLNNSINDTLYNEIETCFTNAHYHISVAIGLAAGIVTSPGVPPELSQAQRSINQANQYMSRLSQEPSQIIASKETLDYVNGLQTATNDPALNIAELIKNVFWTIIVKLNNPKVTLEDYQVGLLSLQLELKSLREAEWQGVFALSNLTINLDDPEENDAIEKITQVLGALGDIVGILSLGVMVYNWKANGVNPFKSFQKLYQKLTSTSPEEADAAVDAAEGVEAATVELSVADILGGVLAVVGALVLIIGTIVDVIELSNQLNQVDSARANFNNQYNALKEKVLAVVAGSEGFRKTSS